MHLTKYVHFPANYSDIFLVPQYSEVTSRKEVDTSVQVANLQLDVGVISANMDTVTDGRMAVAMFQDGGIGAIHRFMSIEQNVKEYEWVKTCNAEAFVSIGVNEESKERAAKLYEAGARYFVIDIAHGHSLMMKTMIEWLRDSYDESVTIMAGNVATAEGFEDLAKWGVDIVKVGVGPGNVCLTKNVTGVTVPQAVALSECVLVAEKMRNPPLIVADGGIREIGDIAKALAIGADLVMCGRMFAGCKEAPGERIDGKKVYRGMASKDAMLTIKAPDILPTPEGMSTWIEASSETAGDVLKHIKGGLQSAFSYSNARTLKEFQQRVVIGAMK